MGSSEYQQRHCFSLLCSSCHSPSIVSPLHLSNPSLPLSISLVLFPSLFHIPTLPFLPFSPTLSSVMSRTLSFVLVVLAVLCVLLFDSRAMGAESQSIIVVAESSTAQEGPRQTQCFCPKGCTSGQYKDQDFYTLCTSNKYGCSGAGGGSPKCATACQAACAGNAQCGVFTKPTCNCIDPQDTCADGLSSGQEGDMTPIGQPTPVQSPNPQ